MRPNQLLSFVAVLALGAAGAGAQWTTDTDANTVVAAGAGDQGTPITAAGTEGSTWVFYPDNGAGAGLKYSLQRLDSAGVAQFSPAVVLSPNRTNTASFVSDMEVDGAGNAIAVYDDNGIYAQKVQPDGTKLWGANGVFLTGTAGMLGPRVCAMADGSAVVCVASGVTLNFRRINADGTLGSTWTLTETGRAQSPSDMVGTGTVGEFILLWIRAETTSMVTSRKGLKIQKWDGSDAQVWNSGVPINIYTSQATPAKGIQTSYFPRVTSDGADGAVVAWYDTGATRNAWLQHVEDDGTLKFLPGGVEGIACSTTLSAVELRLSASATYHPTSQEYTVAYERSNTTQSVFGLSAQRVTDTGALLWGAGAGSEVVPMTGFHCSFINVNNAPNGVGDEAVITWLQYTGANGPMGVQATRLLDDGTAAWTPAITELATSTVNKGRLSVINSTGGDWMVATWGHGAAGSQDVRAMRLNADGTVGPGQECDGIDFNQDGLFPDTLDIDDFISVFGGGPCSTDPAPGCADIDFNNDGLFPDTLDIDSFISVFGGGECL